MEDVDDHKPTTESDEVRTPLMIPYGCSIGPIAECVDGYPRFNSIQEYSRTLVDRYMYTHSQPSLNKVHSIAALASSVPRDMYIIISATTTPGAQMRTTVRSIADVSVTRQRLLQDARSSTCVLFYMVVPYNSAVSVADIQKGLRHGRGPANKIILAVQLATQYSLKYRVSANIYDCDSPFYLEDCVTALQSSTTFEQDLENAIHDQRILCKVLQQLGVDPFRPSTVPASPEDMST